MQGITYTGKVQAVALLPKAEYKLVADCSSGPNGSGMVGWGQGQPDVQSAGPDCKGRVGLFGRTGHHSDLITA